MTYADDRPQTTTKAALKLDFVRRIGCFSKTGFETRVRSTRRLPISFLSFQILLLVARSRWRSDSIARCRRSVQHLALLAQDQLQLQFAAAAITMNVWRLDLGRFRLTAQPVNPTSILPHQPTNVFQLHATIRAHETAVTKLLKMARQNVLGKRAHELLAA